MNNLPATSSEPIEVKNFFDKFYVNEVTFPAADIDAVVGFFQRRNFDIDSARTTAIVILNQARDDSVNVYSILDTFKTLPTLRLNQVVAEILNSYREPTSLLGYRLQVPDNEYESRNILI